jgi:hypothetical protein
MLKISREFQKIFDRYLSTIAEANLFVKYPHRFQVVGILTELSENDMPRCGVGLKGRWKKRVRVLSHKTIGETTAASIRGSPIIVTGAAITSRRR